MTQTAEHNSRLFSENFHDLDGVHPSLGMPSRDFRPAEFGSLDPEHNPELAANWHVFLNSEGVLAPDLLKHLQQTLRHEGRLRTAIELVKDHNLACSIFAEALTREFGLLRGAPFSDIDSPSYIDNLIQVAEEAAKTLRFRAHTQSEIKRGIVTALRNVKLHSLFVDASREEDISLRSFTTCAAAEAYLPKIFVGRTPEDAKSAAGLYLSLFFKHQPPSHYFAATGETQEGVIAAWGEFNSAFGVNLQRNTLSHIDQYFGCPDDAPESFVKYVKDKYMPLGFSPECAQFLHGVNPNTNQPWTEGEIKLEIYHWELSLLRKLNSGLPTLIHMGIGPTDTDYDLKNCIVNPETSDPHIAFVPSGTPFTDIIGLYDLERGTIARDVARGQEERAQAISLGVRSILGASNRILVATGSEKGRSLAISLTPNIGIDRQASALMLPGRRSCVMFIDESAAQILDEGIRLRDWSKGIHPTQSA